MAQDFAVPQTRLSERDADLATPDAASRTCGQDTPSRGRAPPPPWREGLPAPNRCHNVLHSQFGTGVGVGVGGKALEAIPAGSGVREKCDSAIAGSRSFLKYYGAERFFVPGDEMTPDPTGRSSAKPGLWTECW